MMIMFGLFLFGAIVHNETKAAETYFENDNQFNHGFYEKSRRNYYLPTGFSLFDL